MRYNPSSAVSDWKFVEVVKKNGSRFCSDVYADANDEDLADVLSALRLLRASGYPPDRSRGDPEIETEKHKCKGAHKTTAFVVLKAKPSGYRLYFHIRNKSSREAVFLYAVHKKRNGRDPADFDRCCTILAGLEAGNYETRDLIIPDR